MLPLGTAQRMSGGLEARGAHRYVSYWHRGKNTLHLIGLDDRGNRFAGKFARGRIAARLANVPRCLIGIEATHHVAAS